MKKSVMSALIVLLVTFSSPSIASENVITASNILKVCSTPVMNWVDFCNGFFQAVHDQQSELGKMCAPDGITRTNLVEIYEDKAKSAIATSPSLGEQAAVVIAGQILSTAFPCN